MTATPPTRDTGRDSVRERILDVAERLFASQSFAAVSVRQLTAEAGVNLAAINYYFGSKSGLLKAVFLRRAVVLNRERLAKMHQVLADHKGDGPLLLEPLLRALLEPPLRWLFDPDRGLGVFVQFLGRCQLEEEPDLKALFYEDVEHLRRFVPAFAQALPDLSESEIYWRLHQALGAMHYTLTHLERLRILSEGRCDINDPDQVIDHLIDFCKAGFEARR
jgi:AcrR family transcriptional regulator